MLWGLEALRVFDDRLSASLAQIQKAQEAMERTVKQVCQVSQISNMSGLRIYFRKRVNNTSIYSKNIIMLLKSSRSDMGCSQMCRSGHSSKSDKSLD